jgi:hypothetical protein
VRTDIVPIIRETARRYGALGLALAVSAGGKAALLAAQAVPFNADEAVVALMARHILQGERPLFFYGQAYMGSLDAFLAAGGFALFGAQVWVVRAVQILLFSATLIFWHAFVAEGFGSRTADVAALLLAVPPVFLTLYTTASLGGYGEALFFGSLAMLLAAQIVRGKNHPARWCGLGLAAGIGFWSFPLSLVLTAPAVAAALWTLRNRPPPAADRRARNAALLAAGGSAGALPWIVGWIRLGAAALRELGGSAIAGTLKGGWAALLGYRLLDFFLFGLSTLFGFRPSWELRWLAPYLLPLVLCIDLLAVGTFLRRLRTRDEARPARGMLAAAVGILLLVYLFTPFGNDPSGRYLLPLGLVAAAFTAEFAVRAAGRIGRRAYWILAPVALFTALGTVDCARRPVPGITTQFDAVAQLDQRDLPRVIDFLKANGETRGYTNYWVSFPLAFLSDEELIFTARLPYHADLTYTPRDDRYAPYDEWVESAERIAYITTKNPNLDALLESSLRRLGVEYRVEQIGDFRIYYRLSRTVRPEEIFETAASG